MQDPTTEYIEKTRQLGLFPVYPPREEFQVGDIYFWSVDPIHPERAQRIWIGQIDDVRTDAEGFLASRVLFSPTALEQGSTAPVIGQNDLFDGNRIQTRRQNPSQRLPITAFPEVTADAGFTASFAASLPTFFANLAGAERTTVTLDFGDVRTYWLPRAYAVRYFGEFARIVNTNRGFAEAELTRQIQLNEGVAGQACSFNRQCGATLITRVYLTRQINYTYANSEILAAGARLQLQRGDIDESSGAQQQVNAEGLTNITIGTAEFSATDLDGQINRLTSQLGQQLQATNSGTSAGTATFQFEGWNATGMRFTRIFPGPVAIAWNGLNLSDFATGAPVAASTSVASGTASSSSSGVTVLQTNHGASQ